MDGQKFVIVGFSRHFKIHPYSLDKEIFNVVTFIIMSICIFCNILIALFTRYECEGSDKGISMHALSFLDNFVRKHKI